MEKSQVTIDAGKMGNGSSTSVQRSVHHTGGSSVGNDETEGSGEDVIRSVTHDNETGGSGEDVIRSVTRDDEVGNASLRPCRTTGGESGKHRLQKLKKLRAKSYRLPIIQKIIVTSLVTMDVGAGLAYLPQAMANLGWIGGIALLCFFRITSIYISHQSFELREAISLKDLDARGSFKERTPQEDLDKRGGDKDILSIDDEDLVRDVLGKRLRLILVVPAKITDFGYAIVAMIIGSASLIYPVIIWGLTYRDGNQNHTSGNYGFHYHRGPTNAWDAMSSIGTIAFVFKSYEIHDIVSHFSKKKSYRILPWRTIWQAARIAEMIGSVFYISISVITYWAYGEDAISIYTVYGYLGSPRGLVAAVNLMLVVQWLIYFQIFLIPWFDELFEKLKRRSVWNNAVFQNLICNNSLSQRLLQFLVRDKLFSQVLIRWTFLAFITGAACIFYNVLGGLVGTLGGLDTSLYILPGIIWVKAHPHPSKRSLIIKKIFIVFGIVLAVVATLGGSHDMVTSFKGRFW